jgi:TldD protein
MRALLAGFVSLALVVPQLRAQTAAPDQDPVLRSMLDEIERSRALRVVDLDKPYYIEYSLEDAETISASASMGGLLSSNRTRARIPQVQVRTGNYDFDNTNHVYSGYYSGARYDPETWPLDGNYGVLRQCFWLATDRAFKASLESLARKRASLKNAASLESLPDFVKMDPIRSTQPIRLPNADQAVWTERTVKLSELFNAYPELYRSSVEAQVYRGIAYFVNSEGTAERSPDVAVELRARASALAADGMPLHDAAVFASVDMDGIASDLDVRRAFTEVAENIRALVKAPVGEDYSGPVLFDGKAAAQLAAQLIGDNLRISRRPVTDPGRPAPYLASEFETRLNSRVLPEWIDVVDDATQKEWHGKRLAGYYQFDMEGVPPRPVLAIEKGVLKSFLTTRQPVRDMPGSNGHARLQGGYGTRAAAIGNLFVRASQAKPEAQLKAQLIEMIKQQNKPYGLLVRKLDYPTSASLRELRSLFAGMGQSGGTRPVSPPVLVYKVYPDGREELVRGLRFRGLTARVLRDIVAASEETYTFDFVNNAAPFAMIGAGGFLAPTTVVAPSLLFDDVELERAQDELSKPPLVPPPPIEVAGR